MTKQANNHRSREFGDCYADIIRSLKPVFRTKNDMLVLSSSGTAGQVVAPDSFAKAKMVAPLVNEKFGKWFGQISAGHGESIRIESEWGSPLNHEGFKEALENGAEVATLVHNETPAAIHNPAEKIGKIACKYDALFILEAITPIDGDVIEADK
jgi:aspartate aminotransferase-like enzyme